MACLAIAAQNVILMLMKVQNDHNNDNNNNIWIMIIIKILMIMVAPQDLYCVLSVVAGAHKHVQGNEYTAYIKIFSYTSAQPTFSSGQTGCTNTPTCLMSLYHQCGGKMIVELKYSLFL